LQNRVKKPNIGVIFELKKAKKTKKEKEKPEFLSPKKQTNKHLRINFKKKSLFACACVFFVF